jgi:hypothetical protein
MDAGTLLGHVYDAVQRRNMPKARSYLDDNMTFVGQCETYPNADAYRNAPQCSIHRRPGA